MGDRISPRYLRGIAVGAALVLAAGAAGAQDKVAAPEWARGRVLLNLAAHPDDEDGSLIAYYREKLGARVAIIVATRGEGGQNAVGGEMGLALGARRTREMARAAWTLGADLYFLNLPDFGFSKSAEETLQVWGKGVALERLVRLIREIRPVVIATNHSPDRGHGHHRALAELALEAFRLAPDPSAFPDHAKEGLDPHQPLRLFFRREEPTEGTVTVPVGEMMAGSSRRYSDIALEALRHHESQGPWDSLPWGGDRQHYEAVATSGPEGSLGEGLFAGIPRRPKWAEAYWETEDGDALLKRGGPALVAEAAMRLDAASQTENLDPRQARWLRRRAETLEQTLWRSLEILSDVQVRPKTVFQGESAKARLVLESAGKEAIEIHAVRFRAGSLAQEASRRDSPRPWERVTAVEKKERFTSVWEPRIPTDFPPTLPLPETLYLRDRVEPLLEVELEYHAFGKPFVHRWRADLEVIPPFSMEVTPHRRFIPLGAPLSRWPGLIQVTNQGSMATAGDLHVDAPPGILWEGPDRVRLPPGESDHPFQIRTVVPLRRRGEYPFRVRLQVGERRGEEAFFVTVADLRIPDDLHLLVLEGADTTVQDFLRDLGTVKVETEGDPQGLASFDAIVVGARACATRKDMKRFEEPLREYVRGGGHLLVLYHKITEWGGQAPFAPFPLPLSRNRVTREDASPNFLRPDHPLLMVPNATRREDWAGWVQERGLYFPQGYAREYEEILSFADPGEEPLRGGLLFCRHGKGTYVYTSLVWHRQIRAGHAGAARLLANLITPPRR